MGRRKGYNKHKGPNSRQSCSFYRITYYSSFKEERGFTIIEIAVTAILISITLQLFASAYIFIAKQFTNWQKKIICCNEIIMATSRISEDVKMQDDVQTESDSCYIISLANNDSITYTLDKGTLYRNNRKMNRYTTIENISIENQTAPAVNEDDPINAPHSGYLSSRYSIKGICNSKEFSISHFFAKRNLVNLSTRNLLYE